MSQSRDRLARPVDVAELFVNRRSGGVWVDQPALENPIPQGPAETVGTATPARVGAARGGRIGGGVLVTPRTTMARSGSLYLSPAVRRQNTPAGGSRRAANRSALLPSWYPRTPLRNITTIAMAIERRRAQQRETEGQEIGTSVPDGQRLLDSSVTRSGAQLEHNSTLTSPNPTVGIKHYAPGKLPKLFLDITKNQNTEDPEFLTPQKKLLNSIDTVEKVVKEELQKLKRTPMAKRAEREKRVRTLMSMR